MIDAASLPLPARSSSTSSIDDDPSAEIRRGLAVMGVFLGLVGVWASTAPLDAAATASGQITVAGHSQVVQHREGGVVAAVDVTEGQHVKAGQILIELAPEEVGAQVTALRAESLSLQAQRARLLAEVENRQKIDWPSSLSTLSGDDLHAAQEAMRSQEAQFEAGIAALRVQQAINGRKSEGLSRQIDGSQGQLASIDRQQALLQQQLQGVRTLAAKGFAPQNSVRALERSEAELAGAHAQNAANIGEYRQQISQAALQSRDVGNQRSLTAAASLHQVEDELNDVGPKLAAARAQLERGTLRAQTDGMVTGLSVFAPGAVVSPGQRLMEVVPFHPRLVVDARLPASDIEGVHEGQRAEIRLSLASSRQSSLLTGAVTQLSADSFADERTGQSYYTVEVTVAERQIAKLQQNEGADAVRPGIPAQVIIPLRKRNAFDYLFEPLSQALWKSFRQS